MGSPAAGLARGSLAVWGLHFRLYRDARVQDQEGGKSPGEFINSLVASAEEAGVCWVDAVIDDRYYIEVSPEVHAAVMAILYSDDEEEDDTAAARARKEKG